MLLLSKHTGSKGKSCWILYALCRHLAKREPVVWFHGRRLCLFVEEGVFQGPPDTPSTDFKKRIWTLVDADEDIRIPPSLAVHGTKLLNIFVSYPEPSRWKPLEKTTLCTVANMNPWTRKEISQALAHPPPLSTFELTFFFSL